MFWKQSAEHEVAGKTVRLPSGITGQMGRRWEMGQFYEQQLLMHAHAQGRRGTYVDAGMNSGNHALFFAICCPSRRVLGFEPYPRFLRRAQDLFTLNGLGSEVLTFNCALGASPGTVQLDVRDVPLEAPVVRLDDFGIDDLAVLKIDVEGMERPVLEGAERTIRDQKPILYVEIFDPVLDETTAYLNDLGYDRVRRFKTPTYAFLPR